MAHWLSARRAHVNFCATLYTRVDLGSTVSTVRVTAQSVPCCKVRVKFAFMNNTPVYVGRKDSIVGLQACYS